MPGFARDPEANTLDPGPKFTKAVADPGDTIVTGPNGESYTYSCSEASESPDETEPAAAWLR